MTTDLTSIATRVGIAAGTLVVGLVVATLVRRLVAKLMARQKVTQHVGPSMRHVAARAASFLILVAEHAITRPVSGRVATRRGENSRANRQATKADFAETPRLTTHQLAESTLDLEDPRLSSGVFCMS